MISYKVEYSSEVFLQSAGYGKVAHVPFIMDSRPGYHRDGSRYLIDRSLGVWPPLPDGGRRKPPTPISVDSYAHWLANFLEWADRRGVSLSTCSYEDHIYGEYQNELLEGIWSRDGVGLSSTTVNLYVQQACEFLRWMAFKGLRPLFHVPSTTRVVSCGSAANSHGHRGIKAQVRHGIVRQPKRRLRMPSDEEVKQWLVTIYERAGQSLGTMCETVLQSAMRRSEILCMRVDTLPLDPTAWHISNPTAPESEQLVLVSIRYGTKGPSYGIDHGDKIGPERFISIPLHLTRKLHRYREVIRPRLLKKWVGGVKGAA